MEIDNLFLSSPLIVFFLLSVGFEYFYGKQRGRNTYRLNDTVSSLFAGGLFICSKLLLIGIDASALALFESKLALWQMNPNAVGTWIFAFVAYDFCFYWAHRISHERQVFWGIHVVHHQSEYFNLSTALRQPAFVILISLLIFFPLILVGVPAKICVAVATINLIYQYWIHTEHIPKLGWFEFIFATPSNHRVHHGQNDIYLDRNYGGVFIIWDRMFGTFQEELDELPVTYGVREPIQTFNPLWDNAHIYIRMLQDMRRTTEWKNKFWIWASRTGWRPDDVAKRWPRFKTDLKKFKKRNPPISPLVSLYCFVQFLVVSLAITGLYPIFTKHGYKDCVFIFAILSLTIFCTTSWLNGQKPFRWEAIRLCLCLGFAYFAWQSAYREVLYVGVLSYSLFSLFFLPILYYSKNSLKPNHSPS